jgi:hypothetical protein
MARRINANLLSIGAGGVVVGLLLGIIGIAPLGAIVALVHGLWQEAAFVVIGMALALGARAYAFFLASRIYPHQVELSEYGLEDRYLDR